MNEKAEKDLVEFIHDSIIIKTKGNIYLLNADDVIYSTSKGNYTTVYTTLHEPIALSYNLKKIQEKYFSRFPFVRIHQSHIVNVKHIRKYSITEVNKKTVVLSNSDVLPFVLSENYDSIHLMKALKSK